MMWLVVLKPSQGFLLENLFNALYAVVKFEQISLSFRLGEQQESL